jgi:hypothetical protein
MHTITCPVCHGPTREVDREQSTYACDTPGAACYQLRFTYSGPDRYHIVPADFHRFVKACQES